MQVPPTNLSEFASLLEIVQGLRGPDGCPWDKEQTHRTLTPYAIEESHELAEAIENGNQAEMISELGDLLLQVVLHAEIGRGEGRFTISEVIRAISEKMVRRHPHVFAQTKVKDSAEVLKNWAEIKKLEKSGSPALKSERFDIPVSLPALSRAQKTGAKTKAYHFDWSSPTEVIKKVDEEILELKQAIASGQTAQIEHELGDVLFSVAQLARHLNLEAEQCLRTGNQRFERRFFKMKELVEKDGHRLEDRTTAELENDWQRAKQLEKSVE